MTSPNESDRLEVREAFKRWPEPTTAMTMLYLGYPRDMVREEFAAVRALLDRIDTNLAK